MIVYSERCENLAPSVKIRRVLELIRAGPAHQNAVDALIEAGELESGIADALCPESDGELPQLQALRAASLMAARAFRASRANDMNEAARRLHLLAAGLVELSRKPLPPAIRVSVPEGYAFYALYPELYADSARRFWLEHQPAAAVVIGIRSIGTSLSAVVAAELEAHGCAVHSITVRPHGHPFDRRLALSSELERDLRGRNGSWFAIVDEGPGLSGSSFTAVTDALEGLGVAASRIVLFPSWTPDGANLISSAARERWHRYVKYASQGQYPNAWGDGAIDLSAGEWRRVVYGRETGYPPVQPQHERRKILCGPYLYKFEGLGRYGKSKYERARVLADAGYIPEPAGFSDGFLKSSFVNGVPLSAADAGDEFLRCIASYLAFLNREFATGRQPGFDELCGMIRINVAEGLGFNLDDSLERFHRAVTDRGTVAVDGRMLPHEWLRTAGGFLKTDALHHHDDHFFPGCQDIVWDIAGACVEFDLSAEARERLIDLYSAESGDHNVRARLPFYEIAYIAWRMGYCQMSAGAIDGTPDAAGLRQLAHKYRRKLKAAVRCH